MFHIDSIESKNTGLKPIEECQKFFNDNSNFDSILRLLFENTLYITRTQILEDLKNSIERWRNERENKPLYITLKTGKIGSEYYFYYTLKHLLPEHKLILNIIPRDIEDGAEILYLDDWSLTGIHMQESYNRIFYKCKKYPRYPKIKLNYTVITSIMSEVVMHLFDIPDWLKDEEVDDSSYNDFYYDNTKFKYYYTHKVRPFIDILSEHIGHKVQNEYDINFKFFQRFCDTHTLDKNVELPPFGDPKYNTSLMLSSPTFEAYPVHLDYKVANVFGSFPNIYRHCRFLAPSKEFMEDTVKFFTDMKV